MPTQNTNRAQVEKASSPMTVYQLSLCSRSSAFSSFSEQTQPMLNSGPSELVTPSPWKPLPSNLHGIGLLYHSGPGSHDLLPETPSVIMPSKTRPYRAFSCSFNSSFLNPQLTHVHSSLVSSPTKMSAQPMYRPPALYPPHYFQCLRWN